MLRSALPRAATSRLVAAMLATGFAVAPGLAFGHGQSSPLDADVVRVQTDAPPGGAAFSFVSNDVEDFQPAHDPVSEGAALLVRGVGANAWRTPLLLFDSGLWSADPDGYHYSDPAGTRGGITSADVENGRLSITASLDNWIWGPAGPLDAVWVHFRIEDEWYCAEFAPGNSTFQSNAAGHFEAVDAAAPGSCPTQVCGNGLHELGEGCDDGNLVEGDGCDSDCTVGSCNAETFDSTFEGIQKVVFESEAYGCARGACHDSTFPDGELDLTTEAAYESLLGQDGLGAPSDMGTFLRVLPTEPSKSLLYLKLASKKDAYPGPDVGTAMPTGLAALSDEHLEAVRLWIRGGAPRDLVVDGTGWRLGTCFPPPQPLKTPVPDAPPAEAGFQLRQTPYPLYGVGGEHQGETELCMATYYDLSALAPQSARLPCPPEYAVRLGCSSAPNTACTTDADCIDGSNDRGPCVVVRNAMNPGEECVAYDRLTVIQDPQSHHSIINNYIGRADTTDPEWGAWTYKFEADDPGALMNGQPCVPTAIDPDLGYNPGCSSEPTESVACIGYGPDDLGNLNLIQGGGGGNLPQLSLSQETYYDFSYPGGVHTVMPIKGVVVWNSHAFNLTDQDSTMAQFLNIEYAPAETREHAAVQLFDAQWIFAQFVAPFTQKEVCATYTAPRGARIFQLSSHTHRHGTRWRTWAPPNEPCRPECPTGYDDPYLALLDQFGVCDDDSTLPVCSGPRTDEDPYYLSSDYSDPLNKDIDPPLAMDSPNEADRTFLYCAVFDNGATASSPPVKLASTSPAPPDPFDGFAGPFLEVLGGPCPAINLACANEGPRKGQKCAPDWSDPDHAFCDSYDGAGDGSCDACPVHGGVTTEDEMFILLGSYYLVPEPRAAALGAAALLAIGCLARRRARVPQP